jgi:hypothetical protein
MKPTFEIRNEGCKNSLRSISGLLVPHISHAQVTTSVAEQLDFIYMVTARYSLRHNDLTTVNKEIVGWPYCSYQEVVTVALRFRRGTVADTNQRAATVLRNSKI